MRVSGSYTLPVALERAYQMLQDPAILAEALPGCESLEKIAPDEYRMKMKVLLAALSGRIGFLKGEGLLKLSPAATVDVLSAAASEPPPTIVSYEGEAQVGGTMAAVGQRLIDGTAKMMIKKFFDKLVSLTTAR